MSRAEGDTSLLTVHTVLPCGRIIGWTGNRVEKPFAVELGASFLRIRYAELAALVGRGAVPLNSIPREPAPAPDADAEGLTPAMRAELNRRARRAAQAEWLAQEEARKAARGLG